MTSKRGRAPDGNFSQEQVSGELNIKGPSYTTDIDLKVSTVSVDESDIITKGG